MLSYDLILCFLLFLSYVLYIHVSSLFFFFFFFNDTATTEIYTLSLHDALPILTSKPCSRRATFLPMLPSPTMPTRSEEHTSELQSRFDLVCRLLLEKKKKKKKKNIKKKNK